MKIFKSKGFALVIATLLIFATSCKTTPTHTHNFSQKVKDQAFLKESATCQHGDVYYLSCECGEKGEETFDTYVTISCDFSAEVQDEKYLKTPASCQKGAEYYLSCTMCGTKSMRSTFFTNEVGEHDFSIEKPDGEFIKDEATESSSAVYYKSCACGAKGNQTFVYGEPLRSYTAQEKLNYTPTSLTLTLFDTANSVYGITYNTSAQPLRPVIQISETGDFSDAIEISAHTEKQSTIDKEGGSYTEYYIVKAEMVLEPNKTYVYRAYDKYVDVGSTPTVFTARDVNSHTFTFAHVSDTQVEPATGEYFGKVLSFASSYDFIVHTGDVVENSLYEEQWTKMLDDNYSYLSKVPMMAISGNHETTYKNGSNETYKHFNNNIPDQPTTLGYYYSFVYGNTKFIMLNTNRLEGGALSSDQYDWLISELENNTCKWTIVAMHNPMFSAGTYGSNPDRNQICMALRTQLHDIFAEYGVDVVLQGHDHLFSKTKPLGKNGEVIDSTVNTIDGIDYSSADGVVYVMSGTGGTQTRSPYETNYLLYDYALNSRSCSWSEFSVDGNKITVTVKYAEYGQAKELIKWGIFKN